MKNIIIFHTDQLRYDSLGCNGNVNAITPNIDSLSKDGLNFSRHMSANSVCMPSRASLLTGLYPPGHGVTSNGIPLWTRDNGCPDKNNFISRRAFNMDVPNKVPTIGDTLLDNGYSTSCIGKLHLTPHLSDPSYNYYESYSTWEKPETEDYNDVYYGFEHYRLILGHGESPCSYRGGHYGRWITKEHPEVIEEIKNDSLNRKTKFTLNNIYPSKVPSKYHNSMWIADESINYIENQTEKDKPFFMFVGFPDPHLSFTPPEDILNEYLSLKDVKMPDFADRSKIDKEISPITKRFDKLHRDKVDIEGAYIYTQAMIYLVDKAIGKIVNTLKERNLYDDTIIIFTSDHGDFLGDYGCLTKLDVACEPLVHIPFILKPYKGFDKKVDVDTPMSNVDVCPTLLSMIGLDIPDYIQGIDIFSDKAQTNTPMTTSYNISGEDRSISLFTRDYRYTYYIDTKLEELYKASDIKQYHNLALKDEYKNICKDLKIKLLEKHLDSETGIYYHYGLW